MLYSQLNMLYSQLNMLYSQLNMFCGIKRITWNIFMALFFNYTISGFILTVHCFLGGCRIPIKTNMATILQSRDLIWCVSLKEQLFYMNTWTVYIFDLIWFDTLKNINKKQTFERQ